MTTHMHTGNQSNYKTRKVRIKLIRFFILTFVITWILWLPGVLHSNVLPDLPEFVGLFGMFAPLVPSIVAFSLIAVEEGRAGVLRLLKRAIQVDFNKWWFAPTILIFPFVGLLTTVVLNTTSSSLLEGWEVPSIITVVTAFFFILVVGGGLEEFGWRGYALDKLQLGNSALASSLILGLLWGFWHLPLHFIDGTTQANIPVWQFIMQTCVISVLYTWLFNNTKGSLLVAILFHTVGNTSAALLPPFFAASIGRWVNFSFLLVLAILVVIYWGPVTLSKTGIKQSSV